VPFFVTANLEESGFFGNMVQKQLYLICTHEKSAVLVTQENKSMCMKKWRESKMFEFKDLSIQGICNMAHACDCVEL